MNYEILNWLSGTEEIDYSDYWDNPEYENGKVWDVKNADYTPVEKYLEKTGLIRNFDACLDFIRSELKRNISGRGIDLACGNMWAEPLLLAKCGEIEKIYALDYSKHRIFKLGTELLSSKNIPDDKVSLVFGSFYNLRLEAGSLDFVFMSQAFHHAEEPESLLAEIKRVLRPGGIVVIIGEHYAEMGLKVYLANTVKFIISKTFPVFTRKSLSGKKFEGIKLFPGFDDVYKKDTLTGDHYYSLKKYMEMFRNSGFSAWHIKTGGLYQAFVLVRD